MATNNSGADQVRESRPRTNNYSKDGRTFSGSGEKREFRSRNNYQENGERRNNGERRSGGENKRAADRNAGDFKRSNNRNSSDYKRGADRNNGGRPGNNTYKGGNGSRGYDKGFDKDSDDEREVRRKPVQKDSKPKEQQTDKIEIMNRLEKEKKAMKKKQSASQKDNRPARHQARPKRSGNIDWTREYENDSYDDDDLDMYY